VAVKACVVPLAIDSPLGVTAIETSAAALTVRIAGVAAETLPCVALILMFLPTAASVVVAKPGAVALIVTLGSEELHVTLVVMF
jgi:hypothetical protein